jgi:hypothetical protein
VLEFLRWELQDKFRGAFRSSSLSETINVQFEPERDCYAPGETIRLHALVSGELSAADRSPEISNAIIRSGLTWKNPLPGNAPSQIHPARRRTRLLPTNHPGEYCGEINAPETQGYYDLVSLIEVPGKRRITLSEMILIEEV